MQLKSWWIFRTKWMSARLTEIGPPLSSCGSTRRISGRSLANGVVPFRRYARSPTAPAANPVNASWWKSSKKSRWSRLLLPRCPRRGRRLHLKPLLRPHPDPSPFPLPVGEGNLISLQPTIQGRRKLYEAQTNSSTEAVLEEIYEALHSSPPPPSP